MSETDDDPIEWRAECVPIPERASHEPHVPVRLIVDEPNMFWVARLEGPPDAFEFACGEPPTEAIERGEVETLRFVRRHVSGLAHLDAAAWKEALPDWPDDVTLVVQSVVASSAELPLDVQIGRRLRRARERADLDRHDLARRVHDVDPGTVAAVEVGLVTPSIPELYRLADAAETDVHTLLPEHHSMP